MKQQLCTALALSILVALLFSCGDDDGKNVYDPEDEDYIYGPKGGEVTVADSTSFVYGTKVVILPGELDHLRSFWIEDAYGTAPAPPNGFIPWPGQRSVFQLNTGGDKPYDLTMNFYFPVKGMAVDSGEVACAFAYNRELAKWTLVLPDSTKGGVLAARTTYREFWMWGKIVVDRVAKEYLIQVVDQRFGQGTWSAMETRIAEIYTKPDVQALQATCPSLIHFRDGFLEVSKQDYRNQLLTYQTLIAGCGTCDVLSDQFLTDAITYMENKIKIQWYSLLTDSYGTGGDIVSLIMLWKMIDLCEEIDALPCDYKCVTETCGGAFWADFAGFYLTWLCQDLITIGLKHGWIGC
jgi:hypothetical protein